MGQVPSLSVLAEIAELREILEAEWPARTAALRASGVPLNDGDDDRAVDPSADPPPAPAPAPAAPPWGDPDNFDPDRAWKLVQDTRSDRDALKRERDELRDKVKQHDDAAKTEQQLLEERTTLAEQQAAASSREAARLRVALKKGLTETQAKRLVGDSEEDLEADADELLASFIKADDEPGQDPVRRPRERLRPGAAPSSEPEETDPAKLAALVPRM